MCASSKGEVGRFVVTDNFSMDWCYSCSAVLVQRLGVKTDNRNIVSGLCGKTSLSTLRNDGVILTKASVSKVNVVLNVHRNDKAY